MLGMLVPVGNTSASVDASLTAAVGPLGFAVGGGRIDDVTGVGDPMPIASLRWNSGEHNWMTYVKGGIPVGVYSPTSLANLGIGHGSIDAGGGYTYFDQAAGHEFSGVLGSRTTSSIQTYQSGVDMHFDWGASQFLTKQLTGRTSVTAYKLVFTGFRQGVSFKGLRCSYTTNGHAALAQGKEPAKSGGTARGVRGLGQEGPVVSESVWSGSGHSRVNTPTSAQ